MRRQPRLCACVLAVVFLMLVPPATHGNRNRNRNRNNSGADDSSSSGNTGSSFDGNVFLERFGYLDDMPDHNHSPDSVAQAVREFQRFNGLRVTGRLDRRTARKMQQPRCGLPDVVKPGLRPANLRSDNNPNAPLAYHAPGYKWEQREVTYKILGYTRRLGGNQQQTAFANAFRKWADVTPLSFRTSRGEADILISFGRREHGDGAGNSFDGRGGTLAHAFFPGVQPIAGDTHFDDDEEWTLGTDRGTNLEIVAAHEFGHALGMGHSSNPQALMAPFYQGYDANYGLHSDDIRGIQSLYGSGGGGGRSNPRTPRPTRGPRPRPTSRPRPTRPPRGRFCNLKFDAIDQVHDGNIYAFRGSNIYTITSRGPTNRRRTRSVYPGAPSSPGAVVYDRYRRHLYMFKGRRYWRYTGYTKDSGYPRPLPSDFTSIRAAMQWKDGGIYVFKGSQYARWAEGLRSYSSGYPRPANQYWRNIPTNPEAAFRSYDGYYYIFKGRRYWRFNSLATLSNGFPKDMRPVWLNCGRPSRMRANAMELSYLASEIREEDTTD